MEMEFKDSSRRRTLVLVIGVLLAIVAGGAAFYLSSQGGAAPVTVPTREVVVAAVDIPARTTVEAVQLTLRLVPADASNANAYTDPGQVVGKTTAVSIFQFQPITPNLLATGSSVGVVSILTPTETIAPDSPIWRASSVSIPPDRASGGLVTPGQRVDLFATMQMPVSVVQPDGTITEGPTEQGYVSGTATKLFYTDLEVLAKDPESSTYIFKVDEHQAEEIAHMQSLGTQFSLVLRPDGDNREIDRSTYGETTDRIIQQYDFPFPQLIDAVTYPQPSSFPTPFPNVPYLSPAPSASPEASPLAVPSAPTGFGGEESPAPSAGL